MIHTIPVPGPWNQSSSNVRNAVPQPSILTGRPCALPQLSQKRQPLTRHDAAVSPDLSLWMSGGEVSPSSAHLVYRISMHIIMYY
jgi:hypothetical protein